MRSSLLFSGRYKVEIFTSIFRIWNLHFLPQYESMKIYCLLAYRVSRKSVVSGLIKLWHQRSVS